MRGTRKEVGSKKKEERSIHQETNTYYILTLVGAEEITKNEIEQLNIQTIIVDIGVLQSILTKEQATLLGYATRTIIGIHKEFEEKEIKGKIFTISSANVHNQQALREQLIDTIKEFGGMLNYKEPEIFLTLVTIKEKAILCQDMYGDLGKRDYRIFTGKHGLIPTTMNVLIDMCDLKNKGIIAFPWCSDGILAIETVHALTRMSPHKYTKQKFVDATTILEQYDKQEEDIKAKIFLLDKEFRNVNNARKNAILANVEKKVDFSRTSVEDLDLKFDDASVDAILTIPPQPSEHNDPTPLWNDFFKRGGQVLKNKGILGVLMTTGIEKFTMIAEKKGFIKEKETIIQQGQRTVHAIMYRKK